MFPPIDWQAPWWHHWREHGVRVAALVHAGARVHEALNAAGVDGSVRFVPQSALPEGLAYEAFIFETNTVPTRDNLHDFFNGLAWLRFPLIKARLNALQYEQIRKDGVQQLRGAVRDALTLFDENAAFLCADLHAPVIAALRKHDWQAAFQTHRHLLAEHPPVLFGHALLEKLVSPYKSIVAHVFPARSAMNLEVIDAAVAAQLSENSLIPKPFAPLPVLGVPAWWAANENPDFYTDSTVFRAPRP
ncbi:DUF3025 domain-containing protein [Variovorax sp. PCZ-1]|uniref:DUF3025 domain-containing protein n=1 Tax=Variovorax sp. PCZ-1 TaxID=2835533 RepID=UPI001BCFBAB8|nr:DUF3025 domain-containing protein [Variovorax sp. PCZ-1]MBS7809016.1 DUF3025 domain-containing protein [Variovorax sp. PCZ-1]